MPAIKVADFAFPRMEAPDLDAMEEFLTHFGLVRAERTPDALYMRGADDHHHLHHHHHHHYGRRKCVERWFVRGSY